MSTTIITFGPSQRPEKNAFAIIEGCDGEAARGIAFAVFGPEFCTSYDGDSERGQRILANEGYTLIGRITVDIDPVRPLDGATPITDALFGGGVFLIDEVTLR